MHFPFSLEIQQRKSVFEHVFDWRRHQASAMNIQLLSLSSFDLQQMQSANNLVILVDHQVQ